MSDEDWRPVFGWESLYEVSNGGRVRSSDRVVSQVNNGGTVYTRVYRGRVLKSSPHKDRYLRVRLFDKDRAESWLVHRLVARAWLGPCPDGLECCHNDGDGTNNVLSNLRYDTPVSNNADKFDHGTLLFGERHPMSKLTADHVAEIRRLAPTTSERELAALFGVTRPNIRAILVGKTWRSLYGYTRSETAAG